MNMPSTDALELLELLPVWRVRKQPVIVPVAYAVLSLRPESGPTGLLVLHQMPEGEAARLLDNVLRALQLTVAATLSMSGDALADYQKTVASAWLWMDSKAQRELAREAWVANGFSQENILLTPPMESMLHDGTSKAALWAAWCQLRV